MYLSGGGGQGCVPEWDWAGGYTEVGVGHVPEWGVGVRGVYLSGGGGCI